MDNERIKEIIDGSHAEKEFLDSLKKIKDSYLHTVIVCAALVAAGIALAVFVNTVLGLVIGVAAVLIYMFMTKDILKKNLGISHRSTSGALSVTALDAKGKEELWLPSRLIGLDVTEIEANAFKEGQNSNIQTLHLPATIKVIGENVIEGCPNLKTLYFEGSEEEWNGIIKNFELGEIELIFFDESKYSLPKPPKKKKEKRAKNVVAESTAETQTENINAEDADK